MVVAHVGGVPVEEMLPMVSAVGTGIALTVTWVVGRVRRLRAPRPDGTHDADTGVAA